MTQTLVLKIPKMDELNETSFFPTNKKTSAAATDRDQVIFHCFHAVVFLAGAVGKIKPLPNTK